MEHLEAGRFNEPPTEPVKALQELLDVINKISEEAEVARLDYAKRWEELVLVYNRAVLERTIGPLPTGELRGVVNGTMDKGIEKASISFRIGGGGAEEGRKQKRSLKYTSQTGWVETSSEDTVYYSHDEKRYESLHRRANLVAFEKEGIWRPVANRNFAGGHRNFVGEWYRIASEGVYPLAPRIISRALILYADMNSERFMLKGQSKDFFPTQDFSAALEPGSGFWDSENGIGLTETFGVTRELLEGFDETRLGDLVRHVWAPPSIELARLEPERSVEKMAS